MACSPGDILIRQEPVRDSGHDIITRQRGERKGEVVVNHEVPSGPNTPILCLIVANLCPSTSAAIVTLDCPSFSQDWVPSSVMKVDERSSTCQIVNGIPFNFKLQFSVDYQNGQFNENQFSLASLHFLPKRC